MLGIDVIADGIDHDLRMGEPADADHGGDVEDRRPARHAAPHIDTGVDRLAFVGVELLADHRVNAVGADDGSAALRRQPFARAGALEKSTAILSRAHALPAKQQALAARFFDERIEQDLMELAAMNRDLRPVITRRAAERLLVDELAETVIERRFLRADAARGKRVLKPERRHLLHRMRQEVDADAQRLDLRRRLEDAAGNAAPLQHQAERQPANAAADDENVVLATHSNPTCVGAEVHHVGTALPS
jgi:hypothetical protein